MSIQAIPDRVEHVESQSACCSCEKSKFESGDSGCKYRHFSINGDICVTESVCFSDVGYSEVGTAGKSAKNSKTLTYEDDALGEPTDGDCVCLEVCPLDLTDCEDGTVPGPSTGCT